MTVFDSATERFDKINERISLISLKSGLTFGTDSYLLSAFAHASKNGVCAELGGGTGVVSLLCAARLKYKKIYCAELQEYFAELIGRNAALNSLSDIVIPLRADVREITTAALGGEVDSVISNPPYMKSGSGITNASDEMNIARREENGTIADFCIAASKLLRWGGYFTAVYRPDRMAELIVSMRAASLEPKRLVMVYPTVSDKPCLVLIEAKKGAAEGITVSRPLIIYKEKGSAEYTDAMNKVYSDFSLEHLF